MSDLDDKLREILYKVYEDPSVAGHKKYIAQIKKAFEDTHGYPVLVYEKGMMTGQEWEQKALKDGWRRPDDK